MNGQSIYFDDIQEDYVTNKMKELIMEPVRILIR
jgi:hypothetical protein